MRFACSILILVALIVGIMAVGALAVPYTPLVDPLESAASTLTKSKVGVSFVPGFQGNGAQLNGVGTNLVYDSTYLPSTGTVAFDIKPANGYYGTVLSTCGTWAAHPGDLWVMEYPDMPQMLFVIRSVDDVWHYLSATVAPDTWSRIGISYSAGGMQIYVDGVQVGADTTAAFSRANISNDIYVGDFTPDSSIPTRSPGFVGVIDNLKTSGMANDHNLFAVPEPGTLLVLVSGLASCALALRKRQRRS